MKNNVFKRNSAQFGGGLYVDDSRKIKMINILF